MTPSLRVSATLASALDSVPQRSSYYICCREAGSSNRSGAGLSKNILPGEPNPITRIEFGSIFGNLRNDTDLAESHEREPIRRPNPSWSSVNRRYRLDYTCVKIV
jgi:hypothetical protein